MRHPSDGRVACWGQNDVGQLGSAGEWSAEPIVVPGLENVASVSVGSTEAHAAFVFPSSACAVLAGGSVHCWGSNEGGELGDGTTIARPTPAPVTGLNGAVAVSVGATDVIAHAAHACALLDTGSVACWGSNDLGELGDGTTTSRSVPAEVALF